MSFQLFRKLLKRKTWNSGTQTAVWAACGLLCCGSARAQTADVIYYGGKIITVWDEHPTVQAVANQGDRFLAVGSDADVLKTSGQNTRKIDLHGQCVVPGLIAGHVHPSMSALSEIDGPIPVVHSIAEVQAYIRGQAKTRPPERSIFVRKVYSTRVAEHRYLTRQ